MRQGPEQEMVAARLDANRKKIAILSVLGAILVALIVYAFVQDSFATRSSAASSLAGASVGQGQVTQQGATDSKAKSPKISNDSASDNAVTKLSILRKRGTALDNAKARLKIHLKLNMKSYIIGALGLAAFITVLVLLIPVIKDAIANLPSVPQDSANTKPGSDTSATNGQGGISAGWILFIINVVVAFSILAIDYILFKLNKTEGLVFVYSPSRVMMFLFYLLFLPIYLIVVGLTLLLQFLDHKVKQLYVGLGNWSPWKKAPLKVLSTLLYVMSWPFFLLLVIIKAIHATFSFVICRAGESEKQLTDLWEWFKAHSTCWLNFVREGSEDAYDFDRDRNRLLPFGRREPSGTGNGHIEVPQGLVTT